MRITITCPSCQQRSQIESAHRGRRLKCPYPACKRPFVVGDDGVARAPAEQPAQAVPQVQTVPQVVDWQPPKPASAVPAEPTHVETMEWVPPPVRRDESAGFEPPPVRRAEEPSWEPPPVRRPGMEEPTEVVAEDATVTVEAVEEAASETDHSYHIPRKKKSGLLLVIVGGVVLVLAGLIGVVVYKAFSANESKSRGNLVQYQKDRKYRQAKDLAKQMLEKFPNSEHKSLYEFIHHLSDVQDDTTGAVTDVPQTHKKVVALVDTWKTKDHYKAHKDEAWEAIVALSVAAAEKARIDADPAILALAKSAIELAKAEGGLLVDQAKVEKTNADLDKRFFAANYAVAMSAASKQILATIADVLGKQVPGSAERAIKVYDEQVKVFPDLAKSKEIAQKLKDLQDVEPTWVAYHGEPTPKLLPRGAAPGGHPSVSLLISPRLKGDAPGVQEGPVSLALDRGVLYGLSQADGSHRWAMRVGIDTTLLPTRVRAGNSELALVLSAETNTLSAVDTKNGETLWHYKLGSPCSAGPVLAGRVAYLPTEDGRIHVLEPIGGRLHGVYETGQNLSVPGAYDSISQRLFVPASHRRIYVIDLQAKKCAGVIYTNHAVGGLRGAPIISPPSPGQPAILLIAEAETLSTMKLKAFSVPDNVNEARPVTEPGDPRPVEFVVQGWSWFMPYFDGDTIGVATDRGYLALFGLKRGTGDRQVFRVSTQPLIVGDATNPGGAAQRPVGRAQIAAVELGQWWLMVGGQLQPHRFDLYRQQLVRAGDAGLPLGIPLQETQSIAGGQQLVLVTQALDGAEGIDRSLATCMSTANGKINWQRQLGFICGQEPIVLGDHVFAVDKLGGFLHVDTKKAVVQAGQPWLTAVEWLANGAEETAVSQLLAAPDGKSVVAVTFLATSERLRVHKYDLGKGLQPEQTFRLDSRPIGNAALTETSVMLPCRDGTLREFPLAGARELPLPLTWRDPKAGLAVGHAALLSPTQLIISNGLNRLQEWRRSGNVWQKAEDGLELSTGRITTPVLVLPGAENDKYLCVGDDANNLHLYSASRLAPLRQWRLDGKITRGPFACGGKIGCVIDGDRLVCLDPNQDNPLWQYPAQGTGEGPGAIVGEPQLSGKQLVVTHQTGNYVWLNLETGAVEGRAAVHSQAIPTTGVVPFGPGRMLSPLSDGTLMVVTASEG